MPRMHRLRGGARRGRRATGAPASAAAALRPVRAAVFAAVCVVTTALGHALMSGDPLPWWAVGVAFAATASAGWWLTLRERGVETVVGATVVAQGLLHLLFSLAPSQVSARDAAAGAPNVAEPRDASRDGGDVPLGHARAPPRRDGRARRRPLAVRGDARRLRRDAPGSPAGRRRVRVWLWRGEAAVHRIGRALAAVLFAPLRRVCRVLFRAVAWRRTPSCAGPPAGGPERRRSTPAELRHAVVRRGPPRGRTAVSRPSPDPLLAIRS